MSGLSKNRILTPHVSLIAKAGRIYYYNLKITSHLTSQISYQMITIINLNIAFVDIISIMLQSVLTQNVNIIHLVKLRYRMWKSCFLLHTVG